MKNKLEIVCLYLFTLIFLNSGVGLQANVALGKTKDKESHLVFILDASGSMWGQIEGVTKIEIGKKVLTGLLKDLPYGLNVALVAYGHRQKGDCSDVEELIALAPINKDQFVKKIKAVRPKGKTPITLSIKMVVEKLRNVEEEAIIILVSDGRETCEGDPCTLVNELKESGAKFVMHVIGFDVTKDDRKQLECIAEAGGGKYYAAKDAGAFKLAAKKAADDPKFAAGYLEVSALKDGKPFTAYVNVFKHGENNRIGGGYANEPNPASFKLLPGMYEVKVVDNDIPQKPIVTINSIEVKPGEVIERSAKFTGEGFLMVTALKKGKPVTAHIQVYMRGEESQIASGYAHEPYPIKLLPGVYDVKIQSEANKSIKEVKGITIRSGRTKTITTTF